MEYRGWMESEVFPTHVGMNRSWPVSASSCRSIPHARGDEPIVAGAALVALLYSPRTWG